MVLMTGQAGVQTILFKLKTFASFTLQEKFLLLKFIKEITLGTCAIRINYFYTWVAYGDTDTFCFLKAGNRDEVPIVSIWDLQTFFTTFQWAPYPESLSCSWLHMKMSRVLLSTFSRKIRQEVTLSFKLCIHMYMSTHTHKHTSVPPTYKIHFTNHDLPF